MKKCSALLNESKLFISEQKNDVLKKIIKTISKNTSEKIIFWKKL